ncbi:hypothetical protein GF312_18130 [Candidatus Poribacteria bacterium]|nr:hypothetical protein [Candidatus Poribacteria bacterium]
MISRLKKAIISKDKEYLKQVLSDFEKYNNWSLITVIDDLLPLMLMESNLRYGSFHTVKMNLFLRRLALEGYFSKDTEKEILRLIAFEMAERNWVSITANRIKSAKDEEFSSVEGIAGIVKELHRGNVHNAFYYALGLLENDRNAFCHLLLKLGANAIPKSLGHSISCFYPVVEDMIVTDHTHTDTALLTYIMYLARYEANEDMIHKEYGHTKEEMNYGRFLKICSYGTGIVEVHHTITFYLMAEWEKALFNIDSEVPYGILVDWVGEKETDEEREKRADKAEYSGHIPETYEEFESKFSLDNIDDSIPMVFRVIEEKPEKSVDWLFRIYTSKYENSWNPHYYTSLYCALRFYIEDVIDDKIACRMGMDQALKYFAKGIR